MIAPAADLVIRSRDLAQPIRTTDTEESSRYLNIAAEALLGAFSDEPNRLRCLVTLEAVYIEAGCLYIRVLRVYKTLAIYSYSSCTQVLHYWST